MTISNKSIVNVILLLIGSGMALGSFVGFYFYFSIADANPAFLIFTATVLVYSSVTIGVGLLRKREALKSTYLVILLSVGAGFLTFDLYAEYGDFYYRYRSEVVAARDTAKRLGIPYDGRSRLEVIDSLRAEGIDSVPFVPPYTHLKYGDDGNLRSNITIGGREVLPLVGIGGGRAVVVCNERGDWLIDKSDRYGFRNPDSIWDQRKIEIALVGDSFTYGFCVSADENVGALLRQQVPLTLNLGYGGTGPLMYLGNIKEYMKPLAPNVVLFMFWEGNDIPGINGLNNYKKSPILRRYFQPGYSQGLASLREELDAQIIRMVDAHRTTMSPPSLLDVLLLRNTREVIGLSLHEYNKPVESNKPAGTPDYGFFHKILAEAKREVKSWGGRLYLVYLPMHPFQESDFLSDVRKTVPKIVAELAIPMIDIRPLMTPDDKSHRRYYYYVGSHYSADGHRLVAETILARLRKDGVITAR